MKVSIFSVLLVSFLGLIWGTYLINNTSFYFSSQKVLQKHASDIMENVAVYAMEQTQNYLSRAQEVIELTEHLLSANVIDVYDNVLFEKYLLNQLIVYPSVTGVYAATPDGNFVFVSRVKNGYRTKIIIKNKKGAHIILRDLKGFKIKEINHQKDEFNPLNRPWYIGAVADKDTHWSTPYIFYTSQRPGITVSKPSYNSDGSLRAVIGADIEINQLSKFVANLHIGETGKALIISRNSDVVAFFDEQKIEYFCRDTKKVSRLIKVNEFNDKIFNSAFDKLLLDKMHIKIDSPVYANFDCDGKHYQAMLTPFVNKQWPWLIAIYYPDDDFLGGLKRNQKDNHLVTFGISILATILAFFLARSISEPIIKLQGFAKSIIDESTQEIKFKTNFNEISKTLKIFNDLHLKLMNEIKQRKIIEEDLTAKESEYTSLIENINVAIFRTKIDGHVLRANRMCITMLQADDFEDVQAMGAWSIYEDSNDKHIMLEKLKENGEIENFEFRYKKKYGKRGWASLYASLKYDKHGQPLFLDGIIYDISEQKETQESLIISERLAAVGTLAGGVAHEFNNIYTGVLGYAEMGLKQLNVSENTKQYFELICNLASRTKILTTNLLSFSSKKVTGKYMVNLNSLLSESLALVDGEFSNDNVKLNIRYGVIDDLMVDGRQISQVILNLLVNARHALIGCKIKQVDIATGDDGDYTWIKISDSGCGISLENKQKIFTPFFSTKGEHSTGNSPQASVDGVGLGLSVCNTIVENHRGCIEFDSKEGLGSTFTILLPNNLKAKSDVASLDNQHVKRVMVLDDEEDVCEIVKFILEDLGYEVFTSSDGYAMLDKLATQKFDLLLVDLQMPKMSGQDFIEHIQVMPKDVRPAIMVLTGRLNDYMQEQINNLDIVDVISKPFEMAEVQEKVQKFMHNKPNG